MSASSLTWNRHAGPPGETRMDAFNGYAAAQDPDHLQPLPPRHPRRPGNHAQRRSPESGVTGNCHAPFGKRTTEKDPHHGYLAGAPLHSARGPGKRAGSNPGTAPRAYSARGARRAVGRPS